MKNLDNVFVQFKLFVAIMTIIAVPLSVQSQCTLLSGTYTEVDVENCLSSCACSTIIVPDGNTVNLDGDWDLTDQGDLEIRIQGSGSLVFSGSGANAEAVLLTASSFIIIENTSNTMALVQTGGNGQARIVVGATTYDGNDFANVILSGGINTSLPVELISFTAVQKGPNILLTWVTVSEVDNFGFDIEKRSINGDWAVVDFVEGHGNSSRLLTYSFYDAINASNDKNVYYRLRQWDYDDNNTLSNVVNVNVNADLYSSDEIEIYPNPTSTTLNYYYNFDNKPHLLSIYAMDGRLIYQFNNINSQGNIDISDLHPGIYVMRAGESESNRQEHIFIKY